MNDWTRALFNQAYVKTEGLALPQALTKQECAVAAKVLGLQSTDRILDLACGHGRHSIELSKMGFTAVTGLDFNQAALVQARADALGTTAQFVHGDMMHLEYQESFEVVLSFFNSMFYWDDATHLSILQGIHQALVPGGRLLLDSYNPFQTVHRKLLEQHPIVGKVFLVRKRLGLWRSYLRHVLKNSGQPWTRHETITHFNPRTGYIEGIKHLYIGKQHEQHHLKIRLYSLTEVEQLLVQTGFALEKVVSNRGDNLTANSPRFMVVARKPLLEP